MKIEITDLEAELIVEMLNQLWSDGFDSEEANTLFDKVTEGGE